MTSSSDCLSIAMSLGCRCETVKCKSATRPVFVDHGAHAALLCAPRQVPSMSPPRPPLLLRAPWSLVALPRACLTDIDYPSSEHRPLQPSDCGLGLVGVRHRDESKAPRAAGLPIRQEVDVFHLAIRFK